MGMKQECTLQSYKQLPKESAFLCTTCRYDAARSRCDTTRRQSKLSLEQRESTLRNSMYLDHSFLPLQQIVAAHLIGTESSDTCSKYTAS